ncbi:hypothetical protein T09_8129 [Trichinella sp. T9]|nr:hypothetical protein T09_8129 [Trichinella sp. T9]
MQHVHWASWQIAGALDELMAVCKTYKLDKVGAIYHLTDTVGNILNSVRQDLGLEMASKFADLCCITASIAIRKIRLHLADIESEKKNQWP